MLALLLAGCGKDRIEYLAPVRVSVSDFIVHQEELNATKDTILADYTGVKAVTLAIYSGNALRYSSTQLRADSGSYSTFGDFSFVLPMGTYTMQVMAYGSDSALTLNSISEAAYTADKSRETFIAVQSLDVSSADALDISATLHRINSVLRIESTDNRPANAHSVRVTYSAGGKSFNPLTSLTTDNSGLSNNVVLISAVGSPTKVGSYIFLNANQQLMDIAVDVLDANQNVLYHKQAINVPLRRNALTVMQGSMYSATGSGAFTIAPAFDTTLTYPF